MKRLQNYAIATEQKNTPEKKDRKNVRAKQSRSSSGSRRIQKRQMNQ